MRWHEILFHVLMIIALIVIIVAILMWCGEQAWIMAELKNKCIAECVEINRNAGSSICVC